ncbi:hypothetical protein DJ021_12705 [Phenylobacterium hankyongense]|uniref:DUF2188 domain-containing protein n=1 Tax=Phenylobacterium hankyongense TaxID=1813876 RepID=A0A328B432_9CAUL|nr:hypothetical protein [Phenylobacterium hankyongense]RAK60604.1 hypothetical protein DJ021_12705 [Phenylobacterium hankyongense]
MPREFQISVSPVEGGWSVRCDGAVQPLMFLSGARAEDQARALARRLSLYGDIARVLVHDRTSRLVGATCYFGAREPLHAVA